MKINCVYDAIVDPHSLKPLPNNPHTHSKDQIERFKKILSFQGQRRPLIVDKETNEVVAGNGTLQTIIAIGAKEVAVNYQTFDSYDQKYAFVVSDNSIGKDTWATLDLGLINAELPNLGPMDIELLGLKDFVIAHLKENMIDDILKEEAPSKYVLEIELPNEMELKDAHDEFLSRGFIVKIK